MRREQVRFRRKLEAPTLEEISTIAKFSYSNLPVLTWHLRAIADSGVARRGQVEENAVSCAAMLSLTTCAVPGKAGSLAPARSG